MTPDLRIGHGYDIHRIKPGGRTVMAGVVVSTEISPDAHSDGDIVYHAIVDAILGAIGAGDIGEHFSNTDARWKNADSGQFVDHAVKLAREAGYVVVNADVSVIAEKPKLKAFKAAMNAALSARLGAPSSVKAGTNEGVGSIGRGEAFAAHAVVLLARVS